MWHLVTILASLVFALCLSLVLKERLHWQEDLLRPEQVSRPCCFLAPGSGASLAHPQSNPKGSEATAGAQAEEEAPDEPAGGPAVGTEGGPCGVWAEERFPDRPWPALGGPGTLVVRMCG